MASKSRNLTFYYKTIKLDDDITFQQILESLNNLSPDQRKFVEGKKTYLLNNVMDYQGVYYGEIVCFETDKVQSIIHDAVKENNLLDRSITTTDVAADEAELKNSTSEFVNSRIIFGLSDDHLAIHISTLGLQRFVSYFNFLLNTYYWKDPEHAKVLLIKDVYPKPLREKLKNTHVSNVKIGQGVLTQQSSKINSKPFELKDKSLLSKISDTVGKSLGFSSAMDDSNLRVNVTIDYLRNTSTEGQKVLDDITLSLATLDDSYIEINFADGSDYKQGNLRVKGVIKQQMLDNNSFDRNRLVEEIHTFLHQSIE